MTNAATDVPDHVWRDYQGWRSWGQLNTTPDAASIICECCERIQKSLIRVIEKNQVIPWLADARKLHAARAQGKKKGGTRCGFCNIVYQHLWAWQSPRYRLQSQLWTKTLQKLDDDGENMPMSEVVSFIDRTWKQISDEIDQLTDHFATESSYVKGCATRSCSVCNPDNTASDLFGNFEDLCEPCRGVIQHHHDKLGSELVYEPKIFLWVRPTIRTNDTSLSTLEIRHAVPGVRVSDGRFLKPTWKWLMYTLPTTLMAQAPETHSVAHDLDHWSEIANPAAAWVPPFEHASYHSEGTYSQIRSWMSMCSTHEACQSRRSENALLPTRVLEIQGQKCRLRETGDQTGQYVALSYRWGADQPSRLIQENYEQYLLDIDIKQLPKTIRDAIKITAQLGFQFVWVDSMNIIQDDDADKAREITKMRQVYGQSTLTICATGGTTCNEGIFEAACLPGTSIKMPDVGINYPVAMPDGSQGHVKLVERARYNPSQEPLASRGWTYQENLLPVSIVQFGACLSWECNEMTDYKTATSLNGGIDARVPFSQLFVDHDTSRTRMRGVLQQCMEAAMSMSDVQEDGCIPEISTEQCPISKLNPKEHFYLSNIPKCTCKGGPMRTTWHQVILEYTCRSLTNPIDKLPAISGLAEAFRQARKGPYVAGLWRDSLLSDLLWNAWPRDAPPKSERSRVPWRAPSWSWACLDAPIDIPGPHKRIGKAFDHAEILEQVDIAHIDSCTVNLEDMNNPYGSVTGGKLKIRAPLPKAKLVSGNYWMTLQSPGLPAPFAPDAFAKFFGPGDFAQPTLDLVFKDNPDLEGHGSREEGFDVWCLLMRQERVRCQWRPDKKELLLMEGLLLVPADDNEGSFKRVGVWQTEDTAMAEDVQNPFLGLDTAVVHVV